MALPGFKILFLIGNREIRAKNLNMEMFIDVINAARLFPKMYMKSKAVQILVLG